MIAKLKIALLQYDIIWQDVDANLYTLEELVYTKLLGQNIDIVVLPEMFTTGFGVQSAHLAEFMNGKTHKWLKNMAKLTNAMFVGSVAVKENGKIFNRFLAVKPDGSTQYYDKKHLFTYANEHEVFEKGISVLKIEYKGFTICPLICYDLRFANWSAINPDNKFDILLYVANWPSSRRLAWDILLRARAIENQAFVIACNRVGLDGNNLEYDGGSCGINYDGSLIEPVRIGDNLLLVEIYKDDLIQFRSKFPFINDSDSFVLK